MMIKRQAIVEELMRRFAREVLMAFMAILAVAVPAWGGVLEGGLGARAVAMGQAQVAAANDSSAMIYNPAALAYARDYWDLEVGEYFLQGGKVGTDAKLYLNGVEQEDPYASAMMVGTILPLSKRLTAGLELYYPDDWTLVIELFRGPTIHRYRAWRWFYVSGGACLKLTRKLSIGGGYNFTLNLNGSTLNLDIMSVVGMLGIDLGGGTKNLNPAFQIDTLFTETYEFGALYRPFKWMNIGAFYRWKHGVKTLIPIVIPASDLMGEIHIKAEGYLYVINPPQMSFGVALFPNKNLTLAFDMQYDMWSSMEPPGLEFSGGGGLLGSTEESPEVDLKDVWWPKFGAEWKDRIGGKYSRLEYAVRMGYSYYTSPYPSMPTGTNLVDNDAHYFSGGLSFGYHPRRRAQFISLNYFYQYIDLVERRHEDKTRNPSLIISDGHVIYQGITVTLLL